MQSDYEIISEHIGSQRIDVLAIMEALRITYYERPMSEGVSGSIDWDKDKFTIIVNSRMGPQRKRFTAAHEISHYLIHRDLLMKAKIWGTHVDKLFGDERHQDNSHPLLPSHDVQANRYAIKLLLPQFPVERVWSETVGTFEERVADVAKVFDISTPAMTIRLETMGIRKRI